MTSSLLDGKTDTVILTVSGVSRATFAYDVASNTESDSDGTSITVNQPS